MTANIQSPHPVRITATGATKGTILKIVNGTTGDSEVTTFKASSPVVYDISKLGTYVKGDIITFTVLGIKEGSNTYTVSGGNRTVTITTATSAAPSISI